MSIQRNADGYSALLAGDPLSGLDFGNPRKWAMLMDDFIAYDITQLVGDYAYTFTATNCVDTVTGPNGTLNLTLGGADNDVGQLQITGTGFSLVAGKRAYGECKLNLTLASAGVMTAGELFFGLASQQTTTSFMAADGLSMTVDNCVGFVKFDASATGASVSRKADVQSSDAAVWTPASAVNDTLAFYFDGVSTIKFYVNGNLVSSLSGDFPTADMTPTLYVKAGEAKANVLKVDYYLIATER